MAKFIITVKNKSRISLVKLVTIISVIISSNKGNHVWSRSFRRVASFGIYLWNFIATFGGGCYFGKFTVGWDYLRKSLKTGTSRSALQGNRGSVMSLQQATEFWRPVGLLVREGDAGSVTLYDGLYRMAWHASSWYPFYRCRVHEKVGISLVKGYERKGNWLFPRRAKRANWRPFYGCAWKGEEYLRHETCLVPVRRFPSPSRSIRFSDVSETNGRGTHFRMDHVTWNALAARKNEA